MVQELSRDLPKWINETQPEISAGSAELEKLFAGVAKAAGPSASVATCHFAIGEEKQGQEWMSQEPSEGWSFPA